MALAACESDDPTATEPHGCRDSHCKPTCEVDGRSEGAGDINPANECAYCDPESARDAWSSRPEGTACSGGKFCARGACTSACFVGGALHLPDTINPGNDCERCEPATSATAWTRQPNGTACGAGVCESGACNAKCYIDGAFYASGAVNPANACQLCSPETSVTAWSSRPGIPLLAGGKDPATQGWSVAMQGKAELVLMEGATRLETSTDPDARTSGSLELYYPGAYQVGAPFAVRVDVTVSVVSRHNQLDAAASILGAFTPSFGTSEERKQMVFLDSDAVGWADDTQSAAVSVLNVPHVYELSVDAANTMHLKVDDVEKLTRANFVGNGTIAVGDQTNDVNVDAMMDIRAVTKMCL